MESQYRFHLFYLSLHQFFLVLEWYWTPSDEMCQKCSSEQIGNNLLYSYIYIFFNQHVFLKYSWPYMVWTFCLYSGISFSTSLFLKAACTRTTWKNFGVWSSPLHSYLINRWFCEPQAVEEYHHIYRVLVITQIVTPKHHMLHQYFAPSNAECSAKAPPCAFSQLWCCQPEDNACSEEPSAPTDAQLSRGWISAKTLLKHFPWPTC